MGDQVVISTETGAFGLSTGFVSTVSEFAIRVDLLGPLGLPPLRASEVDFCGIVDIEDTGAAVRHDKVSHVLQSLFLLFMASPEAIAGKGAVAHRCGRFGDPIGRSQSCSVRSHAP